MIDPRHNSTIRSALTGASGGCKPKTRYNDLGRRQQPRKGKNAEDRRVTVARDTIKQ